MGYGQYSAGSCRRTKAEMLAHFAADYDIASAKLGGHNRLDFTTRAGARVFTLHLTAVAVLSPEGDRLTLSDGGWPTPTTKSAWSDALRAFGLRGVERQHQFRDGSTYTTTHIDEPRKAERSVTYTVADGRITGRAGDQPRDLPMIRASLDSGDNIEVRFDAEAREIVSGGGVRVRCTPFKALVTLYRIDALARATKDYSTFRGYAMYEFAFEAFGYTIHPGQTSRTMLAGCHTFQTRDIRAMTARIAGEHPEAAKAAKRFVKRHPLDYGIAAYEAAQAARYAGRAA